MNKLSDEQIVKAVHAACGTGRVALTHVNNDGVEVPTDVAKSFSKALSAAPTVSQPQAQAIPEGWRNAIDGIEEADYLFGELNVGVVRAVLESVRTALEELESEKKVAQPQAQAGELPPLPAPFEIDWPELHSHALGCGVEDRGIRDRYEAAEYGWQDGVDKAVESVPDEIYTADQMREYALAAIAARNAQEKPHG